MTTSPTLRPSQPQTRAVLPVIMVALAAVVSAVASLNVALPSVARDTGASQTQLSWIVDAYALVFAALLLLGVPVIAYVAAFGWSAWPSSARGPSPPCSSTARTG